MTSSIDTAVASLFPSEIIRRAEQTRLCVFDVDGVLTDGKIVLGPGDVELKAFNVKDGQGIAMLRDFVAIGVITGRRSEAVATRMSQLGVQHVFQGEKNKPAALKKIIKSLDIDLQAVCYVGDDLPDLAVMQQVGLAVAVADASPIVRKVAHYCTTSAGGGGAAREVCELILAAQGKLTEIENRALNSDIAVDQNN